MKITKLPSGNYRIRPSINGERRSITFDHKPTQKEISQQIYKLQTTIFAPKQTKLGSFIDCAYKYIELKENVLSPSTLRSYYAIIKKIPEWFGNIEITDITQIDCQKIVNDLAGTVSPKTTRNYYAFISSVIKAFTPEKIITVTLPARKKQDDYIPTSEEIKAVLQAAKGTKWYIIFALGCYGLRRSEILPLTMDDIGPNYVDINKTMVLSEHNRWITKDIGKTETSLRCVPIPEELSKQIHKQGFVCDFHPDKILHHLHQFQKQVNVPQFRFHLLRHFFCTELSQAGFTEEDILALGGWSTPHVMKKVYRHNRIMQDKEKQNKASQTIKNLII